MKISYLITYHNEPTIFPLLSTLCDQYFKRNNDEIVIIDDFSTDDTNHTKELIQDLMALYYPKIKKIQHSLNNNYGAHKNFGIESCAGDYIFQIDADELPPDSLIGENLHALLESNPTIEAYAVPRINDFRGVTPEHAKQWGWRLTESPTYMRPIINWPDPQWRIFRRDYPRISFKKKLHEKIEGYSTYSILPAEEEYALYHDKTIEKQIETNIKYNKDFTLEENMGNGK